MFNKTSINHEVLVKIVRAMREAQKNGIAHIVNKKGYAFLAVRKHVTKKGIVLFLIQDKKGNNIRQMITDCVLESTGPFHKYLFILSPIAQLILKRTAHNYELKG